MKHISQLMQPVPKRPAPTTRLAIQAPLPDCLDTLPKTIPIRGRGAVSGATAPPPPQKESANGH